MSDLFALGAVPVSGEPEKKRGRPKGAKNKASGDLLKFIGHETKGLTPGQQLARLVMVTPRDIREAKKWAKGLNELRLADFKAIDPVNLAMSYKAHQLAKLNGWDVRDAWSLMLKAMGELMPYVHQKQGTIEAIKPDTRGQIIVDNVPLGALGNPSQDTEFQAQISFEPMSRTQ